MKTFSRAAANFSRSAEHAAGSIVNRASQQVGAAPDCFVSRVRRIQEASYEITQESDRA